MADPFDAEPDLIQASAHVLHAADALASESYPQVPTDTKERRSGDPGYRGFLIPQQIPEGGFSTEPFTWARQGERLAVPGILHGPLMAFHQLYDYLKSGGKPTDDDAVDLATEAASLMTTGTIARAGGQMASRAKDTLHSIPAPGRKFDTDIPEFAMDVAMQPGVRRALPGEISRPSPKSGMYEVPRYDLEAESMARFGMPYDQLSPDMQTWIKSQAPNAQMKAANEQVAGRPQLSEVPKERPTQGQAQETVARGKDTQANAPGASDLNKRELHLFSQLFDEAGKRRNLDIEHEQRIRDELDRIAVSRLPKNDPRYGPTPPKLPEGITISEHTNRMGQTNIQLFNEAGDQLARIYVRDLRGRDAIQIGNISLDESIQRKGITTDIQRYLEEKFKKPMVPDTFLSDAEYSRWLKIDPESVKNYRPIGEGSWEGEPFMSKRIMQRRRELRKEIDPDGT